MEILINELMQIGLSKYEAKAYLSTLRISPSTAYEIGKDAGIPTSKIYEVLRKLIEKGIVSVIEHDKAKLYVPLSPEEFLDKHKKVTDSIIYSLREKLSNIKGLRYFPHTCYIFDYEYLIDRASRMIRNALRTIILSIWKEEFVKIEEELIHAFKRNVKIAVVHFGQPHLKIGQLYLHPVKNKPDQRKENRGIVIVVDSQEALTANIFKFNKVEGLWSTNKGIVTFAEDYIKHDIYMMKVIKRFDRILREQLGFNYEKLLDIFTDDY